jgi:ABC-type sugar transport system substrate-binding protein
MDKQVIGAVGAHDDPMAVGASQALDGKPQNRAHHRAGRH